MFTVWRIKHIPTGFYFMPSRSVRPQFADGVPMNQRHTMTVKSNLGKSGKTYLRRPSLRYVGNSFYSHFIEPGDRVTVHRDKVVPFSEADWTVEAVG